VHTPPPRLQAGGAGSGEDERQLRERLEDAQWRREVLEASRTEKTQELAARARRAAHLRTTSSGCKSQAQSWWTGPARSMQGSSPRWGPGDRGKS
jgi:hypothetical protein